VRGTERAAGLEPTALALRLTLLEILLRPAPAWPLRSALLVVASFALVRAGVLLAPLFWWLLAALTFLRLLADWPLADNHAYLLAYWCLAVALAAVVPEGHRLLARSARWLCGLAFAFAVLWKAVLSPDFLDGRFFRLTLVQDPRFADTAMLLGGLSPEDLRGNREYLEPLPEGAELVAPRVLVEPPAFRRLAAALTWGGLALEAMVAAAFLLPVTPLWRHAALLLFCAATYAFAPVAGFGCLLIVLGLATTRPEEVRLRALYLAAFLLVLTYAEVPWAGLLRRTLAP
jgi:hypothetical protein